MDLNDYQKHAESTAVYPQEYAITYPILGLAGEAGEVPNKWKKILRDKGGPNGATPEDLDAIADELGDVLWYIALTATDMGYTLEEIADMNVRKLASRKERGVLGGSGDTR